MIPFSRVGYRSELPVSSCLFWTLSSSVITFLVLFPLPLLSCNIGCTRRWGCHGAGVIFLGTRIEVRDGCHGIGSGSLGGKSECSQLAWPQAVLFASCVVLCHQGLKKLVYCRVFSISRIEYAHNACFGWCQRQGSFSLLAEGIGEVNPRASSLMIPRV